MPSVVTLAPPTDGVYLYYLSVSDGRGWGTPDPAWVQVDPVPNVPPVAIASAPREYAWGGFVDLDASSSYDPDNGPAGLSYDWVQVSGPPAAIYPRDPSSPHGYFAAPSESATLTFDLLVFDGKDWGLPARTTVEIYRSLSGRVFVAPGPLGFPYPCGSKFAPCATLTDAQRQAAPGDDLYVAAATYAEAVRLSGGSGFFGGYAFDGTHWSRDPSARAEVALPAAATAFVVETPAGATSYVEGVRIDGAIASPPPAEAGALAARGGTLVVRDATLRGGTGAFSYALRATQTKLFVDRAWLLGGGGGPKSRGALLADAWGTLENVAVSGGSGSSDLAGVEIVRSSPVLLHATVRGGLPSGPEGFSRGVTITTGPSAPSFLDSVVVAEGDSAHAFGVVEGGPGCAPALLDAVAFWGPLPTGSLLYEYPATSCSSFACLTGVLNVPVTAPLVADPRFAPDGWRPSASSPLVDAGVDRGVSDDLDGHPRPAGRAPDLGAFEYAPAP